MAKIKSNKSNTSTVAVVAQLSDTAAVLDQVTAQISENQEFAVAVVAHTERKMDKCRTIWNEELTKVNNDGTLLVRKQLIDRFKAEVGCSKACAATYYQNLKDKAGLVIHRNSSTNTAEVVA